MKSRSIQELKAYFRVYGTITVNIDQLVRRAETVYSELLAREDQLSTEVLRLYDPIVVSEVQEKNE